ncbi:MAG: peptidylprolyl isomerase [Bacillota bacterium]
MIFDSLRNNSRILVYIVITAFVGGGLLVGFSGFFDDSNTSNQNQAAYAQQPENIAVVNGQELKSQAYYQALQSYQQRSQGQIGSTQTLALKDRVLTQMINRELLLQKAKEEGIEAKVSDEEIEEQLDQIISNSSKSKDEIEKMLQERNSSLAQIKENMRENLKQQKLIQNLIEQKQDEIEVSEQEIKDMYEQVTASHILIKTDDRSAKEAEAKIKEIKDKIDNGMEFSQAAKEYSEDQASSEEGGSLGTFGHGKMVPEFDKVAFELNQGEISQPVKTEYGYHLIKVNDKQEAKGEKFKDQKDELSKKLREQKSSQAIQSLIQKYKEDSEIEINSPEIKAYRAAQDGNLDQAIKQYKELIDSGKDETYLYSNLAQAYQQQDKSDQAIKYYQQALEKNPEDNQLRLALGNLYQQLEKKEKAVEEFDQVAESAGDNLMLHYQLYSSYQELGYEDKAEAEKEKLKELQKKAAKQRQKLQQDKQKKTENN